VEWKSLEDIALFRRGSFPQPYGNSEWYDGEGCMPFVQVADVADSGFTLHTKTKQQISKIAQSKSVFVEAGTIVVTLQGTIGRVAITQYDCYVDRTLAIFTNFKVKINKKYFAYQLKAKFDSEKEFARGSTLKTITKEEFSKFQLPLPSINEQNRIVSLLDKFDTLAHSIKQGLPREIELRQKQYEYYRDLLFSFPKPETVSN
ncbi:restriction endonuclease subunit S, partial [Escherichia coli]|nr:restriction endonuclease subunit S [Escherichia coli]EFO2672002.1 restriction endonuclease subunit S [Escherichia coli]EFO2688117.1 restriction endonuclease subunit S [Escherichia coli]EFO2725945.1 restriction endonuclease subunit S [Escherichia coli]EFO2736514.1 restriction endonuclease subunit S [Escherichia coli]